jgi:DNA-binding response OmpR family regulator
MGYYAVVTAVAGRSAAQINSIFLRIRQQQLYPSHAHHQAANRCHPPTPHTFAGTRLIMPRILVVEDDKNMALCLELNLRYEGYDVLVCHTGDDALALARAQQLDRLLLDLMLPGMQGIDVLQILRAEGHDFPVIVVSGKEDELDRVTALRLGADDYMMKSIFSLMELIERVRLRLRSFARSPLPQARLVIDPTRRLAQVDGASLALTPVEFDLLVELIRAGGRVLSKEVLLATVWNLPATVQTHTVDVHVSRLRRKLEPFGLNECIATSRRSGFMWTGGHLAAVLDSTATP